MFDLYDVTSEIHPDTLIIPLRGAYPFYIALEKIAEMNGTDSIDALLLPLGTYRYSDKMKGISTLEKNILITSALDKYFESNDCPQKLLLVDEVVNGGTILEHHGLIRHYLKKRANDSELFVFGVEDGRSNPSLKYQKRKNKYGFFSAVVDSLFTTDRPQYLPILEKIDGRLTASFDENQIDCILQHLEKMNSGTYSQNQPVSLPAHIFQDSR